MEFQSRVHYIWVCELILLQVNSLFLSRVYSSSFQVFFFSFLHFCLHNISPLGDNKFYLNLNLHHLNEQRKKLLFELIY